MKTKQIGLYVHIPFCVKKCNYCDFCSFADVDKDTRSAYINKMCKEIESYKDKKISIDTIFFGGGTPTLLSADELAKIVRSIKNTFTVSDNVEFAMEANPGTTTRDKISEFVKLGVNRFSIGLQSIHENELKKLGRIHSFDDFKRTLRDMRAEGITNINVDLMYGIPDQTKETFCETLKEVTALSPEHLSVYGLILEEGTPFFDMGNSLILPSEDDECDMYSLAAELLSQNGYSHYEISNYAKPGLESKHNLKYWKDQEYIGVGVSAYSYFEGRRYGNTKNISEYISSDSPIAYDEPIDPDEEKYEYVMLALRLKGGFSSEDYKKRFGEDFISGREETIKEFVDRGYMSVADDRISLTENGFYVSNYILTELL